MAASGQLGMRMGRTFLALSAGWSACAAADDPADAATELSTVTVVGQRTELLDSGVVIRVPVDPLVASDLPSVLSTLPGVQVRSSGGLGSYSEASLRGSSGRQVRVLLDGLPLDTGGGDASSLSLISPLLLEQVDVYKGRVPAQLGSGLAGTINLRSRRELAAPVVGTAVLGSFGQKQVDVAAQLGSAFQLAVGAQGADNDFDYVNKFKAFDPTDPDRTRKEPRQNAGTEQYYGQLRYFGPVEVTLNALNDSQQLPTRLNAEDTQTELDTQSYALSLTSPQGSTWQTALSHRYTRETYRDPGSQIGLGAQETRSDTQRSLASIGRRFGERFQDTLTVEHADYQAEDKFGGVLTSSARRISAGNGFDAQLVDGDRHYNASLNVAWSRDVADGEHEEHTRIEPAVGATQRIDACLLAANLGRRERLPTFFERYGDRGLFRGNPSLKPESANYGDVGVRCQPGPRIQRLELTVFGQDLHDAISPTYNAQGVGRSINTDQALIYGVEADSAATLAGFGLQLGGTWQHTEDRSQVRDTRGNPLPGRFKTQLNARIERLWQTLTFYYAYRLEAGQYYDSTGLLKAPTAQRHDIGVRGAIHKVGWALQALDLSNQQAEQFNGYPTPGRRLLLSLTYPRNEPTTAPANPSTPAEPLSDPSTQGVTQ